MSSRTKAIALVAMIALLLTHSGSISSSPRPRPFLYAIGQTESYVVDPDTWKATTLEGVTLWGPPIVHPNGHTIIFTFGKQLKVFDANVNKIVGTVELETVVSEPHLASDGSVCYVADEDGVSVINMASMEMIDHISVTMRGPMVVSPTTGFLYVVHYSYPNWLFSRIDTTSNSLVETTTITGIYSSPNKMVVNRDGKFAHISFSDTFGNNYLYSITIDSTNHVVYGGAGPAQLNYLYDVAVSPGDKYVYSLGGRLLWCIDAHAGGTAAEDRFIDLPGFSGTQMAISPNGTVAYFASSTIDGTETIGMVVAYDLVNRVRLSTIKVPSQLRFLAVAELPIEHITPPPPPSDEGGGGGGGGGGCFVRTLSMN